MIAKYLVIGFAVLSVFGVLALQITTLVNREASIVHERNIVVESNGGMFKVLSVYGRDVPGFIPFHSHYTDCALEGVVTKGRVQADCDGKVPVPGDVWRVKPAGSGWHAPYVLAERVESCLQTCQKSQKSVPAGALLRDR